MNERKEEKRTEDFIGYEEARVEKDLEETVDEATDQEVDAAVKRVNPDKNSMESRG